MAPDLREGLAGIATRMPTMLGDALFELKVFSDVGLIRPIRPDKLMRIAERYVRLGPSPALGSAANALTDPDGIAIIDEAGTLTWERTHRRSNALARGLKVGSTDMVGIIVHDIRDPYFNECARGVTDVAEDAGFLSMICNSDREPDTELRYAAWGRGSSRARKRWVSTPRSRPRAISATGPTTSICPALISCCSTSRAPIRKPTVQ